MDFKYFMSLTVVFLATITAALPVNAEKSEPAGESRGKYLIEIGGCNDCHTAGYAPSGGAVPVDKWLLGDSLGARGPWGTTYPNNLRQSLSQFTEDEWVAKAKVLMTRPPMPWWSVNAMTEEDSRAVYRFITSLKVIATDVPTYVPPTGTPATPYILWPPTPKP